MSQAGKDKIIEKLAIAASFTSEPVKDSLDFWMQEIGISCLIEFAPYNQIFQQLLNQKSIISQNEQGVNIILIRFEDWYQDEETFKDSVEEFLLAMQGATQACKIPYLVCICPSSPQVLVDSNRVQLYRDTQAELIAELNNISNVYVVTSEELNATYPVVDYYDPYGEEEGKIPYTQSFFCALGTMLARKIYALQSLPYKVIVLDCDNTLWSGVCGEDGATGVKISPPYEALQQFIINQQESGKLICLCSKNQENDVFAVFEQHPDMLLNKHHLVNWRINWQPKSENLQSLAAELNLGLDSFIFIDDNPVECGEVKANCPQVLTLQLPEECQQIPRFLQHIWAFDQIQVTKEDKKRTELYQQNVQRQRLHQDSLTFNDFLARLGLEIEINQMKLEDLSRVSQLTQRTNQFNFTTIRRSEGEIQQLCDSGVLECRVVSVKDRFGDYGKVGLLLFSSNDEVLNVDTFLLSCRVLGRGVEHRMLSYLGEIAQHRGLSKVNILYQATQKNKPALLFLEGISEKCKQDEYNEEKNAGWLFQFSSTALTGLIFNPTQVETASPQDFQQNNSFQSKTINSSELQADSEIVVLERIGKQLYSPEIILKEILYRQKRQRPNLEIEFVAPRTSVEEAIASLFVEILKIDRVGIDDNFFELGGNSLSATQLISRLRDAFKLELSLNLLFEFPTVTGLAESFEVLQTTTKNIDITSINDNEEEYEEGIL
ncbi:HAD-IIIC family phosphatase [Plectonema cf. radiosum LEGE 06105]|uniref:HAD-IIIC family phosphatase n=2 Tax=Plectonema TaxID=1183 RepID=A0A8J7EYW5_9CYAN|nr:HAD-IIIC family phosphatase [Plectonema cf. radiosum LEGE 06105]